LVTGLADCVALFPRGQVILDDLKLRTDARRRQLSCAFQRFAVGLSQRSVLMDSEFPPSLREHGRAFVRQLCDLIQLNAFQRSAGRRKIACTDLDWVLRKVDIMKKTLYKQNWKRSASRAEGHIMTPPGSAPSSAFHSLLPLNPS